MILTIMLIIYININIYIFNIYIFFFRSMNAESHKNTDEEIVVHEIQADNGKSVRMLKI